MTDRPGRPAGRHSARLFLVYAVASLIPVLALGAVLIHVTQRSGASRALSQGRAQADVIMKMAVAPALDGRPLTDGLTARELQRLRDATDLAIYSRSLTAISLRSFSGRVVFSDTGASTDALPVTDPAFRTASRGGTSVAVVAAPGLRGQQAIRVLQAATPNATGEATGVLEVYLPYAPIAAAIAHDTRQTYLVLGGGLGLLYLVLAIISWSTTRRLRLHADRQTYHALHDTLTGLPNRAQFQAVAGKAIGDRARGGALVLVDLNRFKEVNDTLGHHAGDELLRCVATRLVESLRTDDHVARLGGDEFGLVLPGATDHDEVVRLLGHVHRTLAQEVVIEGTPMSIEASVGVAFFPEHGSSLDALLIDADAAMYCSKRGGVPTVVFSPAAAAAPDHPGLSDADADVGGDHSPGDTRSLELTS